MQRRWPAYAVEQNLITMAVVQREVQVPLDGVP